jgi:hypothetical protein
VRRLFQKLAREPSGRKTWKNPERQTAQDEKAFFEEIHKVSKSIFDTDSNSNLVKTAQMNMDMNNDGRAWRIKVRCFRGSGPIIADAGHESRKLAQTLKQHQEWQLRIVKRRQRAFKITGLTWIIERSFAWLGGTVD